MRLLFLTNFYPPASRGGYEMWCQEVAEQLTESGHQVVILTTRSKPVADAPRSGLTIARELYLEMEIDSPGNPGVFFFDRARRQWSNLKCLDRWLDSFRPQSVVIWGMWNLDRSLAARVERRCRGRTVYYFGDYWPTLPNQWWAFWGAPARRRLARAGKWLLRKPAERMLAREQQPELSFPHGLFPSEFMRRSYEAAGIRVTRARVVRGGASTFVYRRPNGHSLKIPDGPVRVLVAGRLTPEKGIETAIEAVAVLAARDPRRQWRLTIAGTGEQEYVSTLADRAAGLGVSGCVQLVGAVAAGEMPRLFRDHDVFVFPSVWDEPFGRVLVEAMAAGVPVVGTRVGGAAEILRDGETGLAFMPGDVEELARQLERVADDPALRGRLTAAGERAARMEFDISRMAVAIETYLREVIQEEDNFPASRTPDARSRWTSLQQATRLADTTHILVPRGDRQ